MNQIGDRFMAALNRTCSGSGQLVIVKEFVFNGGVAQLVRAAES